MPAPPKTSLAEIVAAGRRILEVHGLDRLSLQAVAHDVGVRAPSLYKRIGGRGDLIRRISNQVATDLGAELAATVRSGDPAADIRAMARAVRAFARANPRAYALLFADLPDEWRADPALNAQVSTLILRAAEAVAGPADALPAARTVVAWLNGFVAMELAGAFRLSGDLERAFDYGIDTILAGVRG